jgi:hypothetical protein
MAILFKVCAGSTAGFFVHMDFASGVIVFQIRRGPAGVLPQQKMRQVKEGRPVAPMVSNRRKIHCCEFALATVPARVAALPRKLRVYVRAARFLDSQ